MVLGIVAGLTANNSLDPAQIKSLAAGKMGHGTREVGDLVAAAL